jgi:carboxymethylenebutenolidase
MLMKSCWVSLAAVFLMATRVQAGPASETVAFPSGDKVLHGLLYKPSGNGPYPAVVYNHGSSPGLINNAAFDAIAPYFTARGWVFFAPYRRGQGLSADAGVFVGTRISEAEKQGHAAGDAMLVRLLSGEQLDDQLAAAHWLKTQSFVKAGRVAVMGNSFGGIETVLGAARHPYCAAVNLTGAAMSWDDAPMLREAMTQAVQHAQAPILFIQAENDFSTEPSRVLYAAALQAHRQAQIHIYPPFQGAGSGGMQGHSFAWLGVSLWFPEAFGFIDAHCH